MYIDAHNHMDQYEEGLEEALDIIKNNNILTVGCSMDMSTYELTKEISRYNKLILPCYGIHPFNVSENLIDIKDLDLMRKFIKESFMIGEVGLDFHWSKDKRNYPLQIDILKFFLKEAKINQKILNLHTKGGEEKVLELLKGYSIEGAIIHWYSGPLYILDELIDRGYYFTIGVDIKYSKLTRKIVEKIPINKILTETDGAGALKWVNGEYGNPDYIKIILNEIGKIKGYSFKDIRKIIFNNFNKLINNY